MIHSKNNVLWIPMRRLMAKVSLKRERELAALAAVSQITMPSSSEITPSETPSAPPSVAPDEPHLNPIRPLQQGLPQMWNNHEQQAFNDGTENNFSQFYSNEFASNDIQSELSMQYQQSNSGNVNWVPSVEANNTNGGSDLNWDNFDDLVRDFQMEVDASQPEARGPVLGGMGNWW